MCLNDLISTNYKQLYSVARKIVATKNNKAYDARELISETYLSMVGKKVEGDNFVKYFSASMKHQFIGARTGYSKVIKSESNDLDIERVVDSDLKPEHAPCVKDAENLFESLPGHLREMFKLHFEQGLSARDIAREMEKDSGWKTDRRKFSEMINEIKYKGREQWLRSL